MRVELRDGNHAELRDRLTAGDRRAAKAAMKFTIGADEERILTAEMDEKINYALLRAMIVSWSLPQTLPRNAASDEVAEQILDGLDIEDIEALCEAIKPQRDRVMNGPKAMTVSGSVLPPGSSVPMDPAP